MVSCAVIGGADVTNRDRFHTDSTRYAPQKFENMHHRPKLETQKSQYIHKNDAKLVPR
jgi:hypothetical protein